MSRDSAKEVALDKPLSVSASDGSDADGPGSSELLFVASVSHELRGPLHAILGISELLLEANLRAEDKRLITVLNREAVSLQILIDDILDFARMSSGKLELIEQDFSPSRLLADLLETLRPSASQKNLSLLLEVSPEVPKKITGDGARFNQIARNLLINAIRYTDKGSITATLSIDETGALACKVTDTGIGIAEQKLVHLFDPFVQEKQGSHGGAGLGLAICSTLVRLMEGTIEATSQKGEGSTFRFSIPFTEAASSDDALAEQTTVATMTMTGKILVVEDNEVNQMLAKSQLETLGFEADIAGDGESALTYIDNEYVAILMDWNLPGIDGLETTRRIRQSSSRSTNLPIIAMTANVLSGDKERCLLAGMSDFLPKPVGIKALSEVLEKWTSVTKSAPVEKERRSTTLSVDESVLSSLVDELGSQGVVKSLIETFLRELPAQLESIVGVLAEGDTTNGCRAAHTLKSTAKLLGANQLADLCEGLRDVGVVDATVRNCVKQITEEGEAVRSIFTNYIYEIDKKAEAEIV